MSFYVTLPSNSSMELYPNNKLTNYTTKLKIPIRVNTPYEVALVEATFDQGWLVDLGECSISSEDSKWIVFFPVFHHDGQTIEHLLFNINSRLSNAIRSIETFSNVDIDAPKIILSDNKINFNLGNKLKLHLSPRLEMLFNLSEHTEIQSLIVDVSFLNNNIRFIKNFYIYTDIIKYQFVGDTMAPLLRTLSLNNNNLNNILSVTYDSPHYIPLNSSTIETINITIKDDLGNNILFDNGKVITKLHFQPIKYGF